MVEVERRWRVVVDTDHRRQPQAFLTAVRSYVRYVLAHEHELSPEERKHLAELTAGHLPELPPAPVKVPARRRPMWVNPYEPVAAEESSSGQVSVAALARRLAS